MRQAAPGGPSPSQKLAILARLQRAVRAAHLGEHDQKQISDAIGEVGARLEADAGLVAQIVRAPAPAPKKLAALLKLAAGEAGPLGPSAERARAEAVRLLRAPRNPHRPVRRPRHRRRPSRPDAGGGPGGLKRALEGGSSRRLQSKMSKMLSRFFFLWR